MREKIIMDTLSFVILKTPRSSGSRMRGGVDEEVAERNRWIQAEQKRINDSVQGK